MTAGVNVGGVFGIGVGVGVGVGSPVTVWETPLDTLPVKFASLPYVAVNVRIPLVVKVIIQLPAATVAIQLSTPSDTVTVPVGVPAPGEFTATE